MGAFDNTTTTSRFAPSLFNFDTSGGSFLNTAQTGPDQFHVGVTLPQDIHALRAEELGGLRNLLSSIQGERGSILNARLNPLRQKFGEERGILGRGLARRNVAGSLANNEILKFNQIAGREMADARALANQDLISAEESIYGKIGQSADRFMKQELASLGLSQAAVNSIIDSMSAESVTESDPGADVGAILDWWNEVFG